MYDKNKIISDDTMFLPSEKAMHLRRDEPNGSDMPSA